MLAVWSSRDDRLCRWIAYSKRRQNVYRTTWLELSKSLREWKNKNTTLMFIVNRVFRTIRTIHHIYIYIYLKWISGGKFYCVGRNNFFVSRAKIIFQFALGCNKKFPRNTIRSYERVFASLRHGGERGSNGLIVSVRRTTWLINLRNGFMRVEKRVYIFFFDRNTLYRMFYIDVLSFNILFFRKCHMNNIDFRKLQYYGQ